MATEERSDFKLAAPGSCTHLACRPVFDEQAAQGLTVQEVRARWPRFFGVCPSCGMHLTMYASWAHFAYGGWGKG
jgi:hypothetical protein